MKILPAIDLLNGKCVQLIGGDPNRVLYSCDPFEKAEEFSKLGALWIIDLNAALGNGSNLEIIKKLLKKYPAFVGGGIRTIEKANELLGAGAEKIIIGTKAVQNPFFIENFDKEKIIVAFDFKNDRIAIEGWQKQTDFEVKDIGAKYYLATNIDKEGKQEGVDFNFVQSILGKLPNMIISGGISSIEDVQKLKELGVFGVVIGAALYSGKIKLEDLLKC